MNLVLLISLSVAILLAVVEFLSGSKKMWIRFSCCFLSVVALSSVYLICKDDAGRLHKIKSEATNSRQLLQKAENVLASQSAILSGEVAKIHKAITSGNPTDSTVKHSLHRLQDHIRTLQKSSKQLNAEMLEVYADKAADSLSLYDGDLEGSTSGDEDGLELTSQGNN